MTSFSPLPETPDTAVPGVSVEEKRALGLCTEALSDAQYLSDLATLDRIEVQRECFFDVMGEIRQNNVQGRAPRVGTTA